MVSRHFQVCPDVFQVLDEKTLEQFQALRRDPLMTQTLDLFDKRNAKYIVQLCFTDFNADNFQLTLAAYVYDISQPILPKRIKLSE